MQIHCIRRELHHQYDARLHHQEWTQRPPEVRTHPLPAMQFCNILHMYIDMAGMTGEIVYYKDGKYIPFKPCDLLAATQRCLFVVGECVSCFQMPFPVSFAEISVCFSFQLPHFAPPPPHPPVSHSPSTI